VDGARDIEAAAAALAARLPPALAPLARAAYDYSWSWSPGGASLFRAVSPRRWEICDENPVRLLQEADSAALARAAADPALVRRAEALAARRRTAAPERPIAFFCAEYALHRSLPIYSGGLGALAGDIVKQCSDEDVPLVAVGLLYRQGYFHQRLDASGWQVEYWQETDVERLPAALVTGADGEPLVVAVGPVRLQIWRVDIGRVPLYLLDSARPENGAFDRWITSRLYVSDRDARLLQYLALGIGGVRALRAMGIEPRAIHLNEGHAAFAPLELAREGVAAGMSFGDALAAARARTLFTTHTPVPAGNESYPPGQILGAAGGLVRDLGIGAQDFLALGRIHPADATEPFGVTTLALRTSRAANAVSRRHGGVARAMWNALWPDRRVEDVPIGHVTNGVHVPTWMAPEMRALLGRWPDVGAVPAEELWAVRGRLRAALVDYVRERSQRDRLARGDARDYVEAAARAFDPGALTIGFARRLATYKRVDLITRDPARSLALLSGPRRIQVVIAGKAHPADGDAKRVVQQQLFPLRQHPHVGERVAYLEDYDLSMALMLVRGCDVWVNLPRPPLEASGTSGMKAAMNGALNLSVLDGWWAEASDGSNGWSIGGEVMSDPAAQDERDAATLYDLLEREVVPLFYERDADGIPRRWLEKVKRSLATLAPRFDAGRMIAEYRGRWDPIA
jgi:starch phosphorylase